MKGDITKTTHLFERIVSILEEARKNVVRSVNSNMVIAYWLIGKEIVENIQSGKERAEYGKQVLKELSNKLKKHYDSGFSVPNLKNFRQFYLVYVDKLGKISYPAGSELGDIQKIAPIERELILHKNATRQVAN